VNKFLRIGISVALLGIIAWRMNWADMADKFAELRIEFWLAAVGVLVVGQVLSARRWQLFAQELRFERSLMQYTAYYFIGMYFNLSLPSSVGGDVVRVFYLNNHSGRKWAAFASVALERLNGLSVLIAVACIGVLVAPMPLPSWILISVWSVAGCAVLGLASLPIVKQWKNLALHRRQQLETLFTLMRIPHVTIWATVMSILVQVLGVVAVWLIGLSLGLEIPFTYCCILSPMVSLLTLLPISFNGMGLRELGTVVFLAPLGIGETTATTLAVLWFAVTAAVSLMGGMIYMLGAYPKAESEGETGNEGTNHGPVDRDSDQGREGQSAKAA